MTLRGGFPGAAAIAHLSCFERAGLSIVAIETAEAGVTVALGCHSRSRNGPIINIIIIIILLAIRQLQVIPQILYSTSRC